MVTVHGLPAGPRPPVARRWSITSIVRVGARIVLAAATAGLLCGAALAAPSAPAFDTLARQLEAEPMGTGTFVGRQGRLDRLRVLLPSGDEARALRYRALRCGAEADAMPGQAEAEAQALFPRARAYGDVASEIRLRYCRADALEHEHGDAAAMQEYAAGIELARRHRLPALLGNGLALRAHSLSGRGEQAGALIDLLQAQRVYEEAGLQAHARHNLLGLAMAYRRMGDYERALQLLRRATAEAPAADDWVFAYDTLLQHGYLLYDRGEARASLAPLQEALELAERHDTRYRTHVARFALATSQTQAGSPDRALELLAQAEAGLGALAETSGLLDLVHLRRGEALAALGRHREALAAYARAYAGLAKGDNLRYLAVLHRVRAASFEAVGAPADALAEYRRHVAAATELEQRTRGQQDALLRHQFQAENLEFEHRRLVAQKALQERKVGAAMYERRWQGIAIATSALLLLLLAGLGLHQLRHLRRLRVLAMTDSLTGIANRRRLERFAEESLALAVREGGTVTVLALDIDHFKPINDRHGHALGDEVLRRVADVCQTALRQFDLLGRTGGEEFVIVLPRTAMEPARRVAERLRAAVEALDLSDLVPDLTVTISIGGAQSRAGEHEFTRLLHRADVALYLAKQRGRNRVEFDDGRFDSSALPDDIAMLPLPTGPRGTPAP